jgi:phosphoadenylyl-sulfate reductase (thioredoxin)
LREAVAEFSRPVMLYSIGKDSSVMLRLAQKAFYPGRIPFPLLHADTSQKFPEMIHFRDTYTKQIGVQLIVHRNLEALDAGANPFSLGTQKCCGLLKTRSLEIWFTGLRREQSPTRKNLKKVEEHQLPSGKRLLKVSLLADWSWGQVWQYTAENKIDYLSLYDRGYLSIGCEPCTALPNDANNPRSGRWGEKKLECGIHTSSEKSPG